MSYHLCHLGRLVAVSWISSVTHSIKGPWPLGIIISYTGWGKGWLKFLEVKFSIRILWKSILELAQACSKSHHRTDSCQDNIHTVWIVYPNEWLSHKLSLDLCMTYPPAAIFKYYEIAEQCHEIKWAIGAVSGFYPCRKIMITYIYKDMKQDYICWDVIE